MFHVFKYLLLVLAICGFLNIFRSNSGGEIILRYDIPLIRQWESVPLSVNFLLVTSFCLGILVAAFLGAFRLSEVRAKKRELKKIQEGLSSTPSSAKPASPAGSLPPLAE